MNRIAIAKGWYVLIGCAVLTSGAVAVAQQEAGRSTPANRQMMQAFGVDEARISALRDQKFGDEDIQKILTIAHRMPGGISDRNVDRVVQLRQDQQLDWDRVSQAAGTGSTAPIVPFTDDGTRTAEEPTAPGAIRTDNSGLDGPPAATPSNTMPDTMPDTGNPPGALNAPGDAETAGSVDAPADLNPGGSQGSTVDH